MSESDEVVQSRFSVTDRRLEAEAMDDPLLDEPSHLRALAGLARLNRLSLTAGTLWARLSKTAEIEPQRPVRVLDLACGGGDITRRLARLALRSGRSFRFDGCDVSARAVRYAAAAADQRGIPCRFFQLDILSEPLPGGYDYCVSSLFLHHLEEARVVELLHRISRVVERGLFLTDLDRSMNGFLLAALVPRLVTRSPVVHDDAVLSVRAAFAFEEMEAVARRAGLEGFSLTRRWPCRWMLSWQRESSFGE